MPPFQKLPALIEAVQWRGDNLEEVLALVPTKEDGTFDLPSDGVHVTAGISVCCGDLSIPTLHGPTTAELGDWVIRGEAGDLWPCKPAIFERTYEAV